MFTCQIFFRVLWEVANPRKKSAMESELIYVDLALACCYSCLIFFQIRDKEKSNGQLREELGGVLEKNKNIMEEVNNRKYSSYSVCFLSSFSLVMYLNCACFIFQIAARDADIRVLRTDLSSAQKKIKNHSNEVIVFFFLAWSVLTFNKIYCILDKFCFSVRQ